MDKLSGIKLSLILEQAFFGYLIMHIQFKRDNSIENMGADGEKIYYNEKYIEEANEDEIKFLIMHQILHLILSHIVRSIEYTDRDTFSKASDLVVNSIIHESLPSYQIGNVEKINTNHTLEGKEASNWTVDQVYEKIKKINCDNNDNCMENDSFFFEGEEFLIKGDSGQGGRDDHSMWEKIKGKSRFEIDRMSNKWLQCVKDAMDITKQKCGDLPGGVKKFIKYVQSEKVDWKDVLRNFVETEVTDYSFNPPDKRYSEESFFLPDFNETEDKVTGIFFFIDVSGSMSDEQIAECKAELRSCIKQYNERVEGYLGYFDYNVSNVKSFDDEESMENIESLGGGGTSFINVFKYLDENADNFEVERKKVVIMTDGGAEFPSESDLNVDEVLWIINNDFVTPPFGEVVRI